MGLLTTGLTETQGTDIHRVLKIFRERHPEFQANPYHPGEHPDFSGGLNGFAAAVQAMIEHWTPSVTASGVQLGRRPRQINVLCGPSLTPGDLEALKGADRKFRSTSVAATRPERFPWTVIWPSTNSRRSPPAAPHRRLRCPWATPPPPWSSAHRCIPPPNDGSSAPVRRCIALTTWGLEANDRLIMTLAGIAGCRYQRGWSGQRTITQDAMLDTHFCLAKHDWPSPPTPICCTPRLHAGRRDRREIVAAVTSCRATGAGTYSGDPGAHRRPGRSGATGTTERGGTTTGQRSPHGGRGPALDPAVVANGFPPLYDQIGAYRRTWIGYRGSRQTRSI